MSGRVLDVDVAVIGAGPTGLAATALLGRNHKVALLERHPARYSLPRAGHVDHEIMRILQGLGAERGIIEDQQPCDHYHWVNGERQTLFSFPYGAPSISGFQSDYMMYQPVLEDGLYAAIEAAPGRPSVEMGWEMVDLEQGEDGVVVTARRRQGAARVDDDGEEALTVRARYVLAADGAKSPTRNLLGIGQHDYGFSERWLDIDVRIERPLPQALVELDAFQVCDPNRPILLAPLGKRHFRWEWMLFDGESDEDFERPDKAWELLAEWDVGPDQVEILRDLVYTFEAKIATCWRQGRVFLLGDAVHTMPPHMGQGMCSGVRDSMNLAWKLALVLRGAAREELLDSYEEERRPHADAWIRISKEAGEISCIVDPAKAKARDEELLRGTAPPMPEFPRLGGGTLPAAGDGPTGTLFPQAEIVRGESRGLFHDIVGQGFHLVSGAGDPTPFLDEDARRILASLDATVSVAGGAGEAGFADPTGVYREYFVDQAAVLVRPDYYVHGAVERLADLPDLIAELGRALSLGDALASA